MTDIIGYSVPNIEDYTHFCDMDYLIIMMLGSKVPSFVA